VHCPSIYTDVLLLLSLAAAVLIFRWLDRPRLSRQAKRRLQEIARERRKSEVQGCTSECKNRAYIHGHWPPPPPQTKGSCRHGL
jgi:hypothetical protein